MAPVIQQAAATGSGGVWLFDQFQAFPNSLEGGNALIGFGSSRPSGCVAQLITISDSQSNSWVNLPVDNASGNACYRIAYSLSSIPGADTAKYVGTDFCGFTYDPCTSVMEIAGVAGFGSAITTSGTSSVPSGSITTPIGTYSFSQPTSHSLWFLNMVYLTGGQPDTGIVLAMLYVGDSFSDDAVSGWAFRADTLNLHTGVYTTVSAPPPSTPIDVFVSIGNTRTF